MGKLKSFFIGAAAVACVFVSGSATAAGDFMRGAAYFAAGVESFDSSGSLDNSSVSYNSETSGGTSTESPELSESSESSESDESSDVPAGETSVPLTLSAAQRRGRVIVKNRVEETDNADSSEYTKKSGAIERYNFGYFGDPNIITLSSGAQVRNCTEEEAAALLAAAAELPKLLGTGSDVADEPQVLIYHTHTSESFLPYGDSYDADYPLRSSDCSRNMIAVGDAICEALAERGVASVHDCRVHDYPMFTGAYYRSAETLLEDLEEYPSIKIAIDIHRDGILNADGSVTAPTAEINGRTAAQFMIITGCDGPETEIPEYMENFRLACLVQNAAEARYPTLARPVLFDYRNYNQSLFAGSLLIEVGSQGNSLEEAVYAGELLGSVLADVVRMLDDT